MLSRPPDRTGRQSLQRKQSSQRKSSVNLCVSVPLWFNSFQVRLQRFLPYQVAFAVHVQHIIQVDLFHRLALSVKH